MAKKAYIGVENFVRRNLPEGYTQVAYIESTGTQYLNTRFCPSYNTRVVVEISDATTEDYIFGARDTDSTTAANQFGVYINANSKLRSDYFGTSVSDTPSNIVARTIVDKNANVTTAFGLTITNTAVASGAVSYPLWLFALNNVGTIKVPSSLKMWSALIYGNGIDLDRDYVTCIQDSTGIAGMYDMVTNTFEHSAGTEEFIAGPTYESIARKLKKGYVGVVTDVPIYETATVNITDSNIGTMFAVSNGSYYFKGSGGTFTTTNGGVNSSTATTTLTALKDMDVSFTYSYSSESDYDKFTLTVAEETVEDAVSGSTTTKIYSGSLTAGQTIVFTYAKDTSQHKNDDKCTFSNMVCMATTQTGVETKPVARKIKKAYIGIGGVARPCWSGGELAYYGTITSLSVARCDLAATNVGNYALFGGGITADDVSKVVDAYDKSLTRSTPTSLMNSRTELSATTVGDYALFAGGYCESYLDEVDAYNSSLTRSTAAALGTAKKNLCGGTTGNFAVFAGGYDGDYLTSATAYDASLTRSILDSLPSGARYAAAAGVGDKVLIAGGNKNSSTYQDTVTAYSESHTRITASGLEMSRTRLAAASVGGYVLFAGGEGASYPTCVDAYDSLLTHTIIGEMSAGRAFLTAASLGEYALFCGGYTMNNGYFDTVDVYDSSLTRTVQTPLSKARADLAAAVVGDYLLVGGGESDYSTNVIENTVDAYTIA